MCVVTLRIVRDEATIHMFSSTGGLHSFQLLLSELHTFLRNCVGREFEDVGEAAGKGGRFHETAQYNAQTTAPD